MDLLIGDHQSGGGAISVALYDFSVFVIHSFHPYRSRVFLSLLDVPSGVTSIHIMQCVRDVPGTFTEGVRRACCRPRRSIALRNAPYEQACVACLGRDTVRGLWEEAECRAIDDEVLSMYNLALLRLRGAERGIFKFEGMETFFA